GLEPLEQLDALGDLLADLLALGFGHGLLQQVDLLAEIDFGERIADGFSTHLGDEGIRTVGFARFAVFVLAEQLVLLERCREGIDDHVILVINDALEIASGHVENQADARGHALKEPDVAYRHREFDVAHPLTADAGQGDLDAAAIADDAAVLD